MTRAEASRRIEGRCIVNERDAGFATIRQSLMPD